MTIFTCRNFCYIAVLLAIVLLPACLSKEKLAYVQDTDSTTSQNTYVNHAVFDYHIQPYDELYIQVTGTDAQLHQYLNRDIKSNAFVNLITYKVDSKGFIDYAYLGKVQVKGLTTSELADSLETQLAAYLKQAEVFVKVTTRYISILGEINKPGRYLMPQDRLNVFQALAMAGDLTDYGERHTVKLIREKEGEITYHYLDLTDKSLVESEFYYLQPNDILYVEPSRIKFIGFKNIPYATLLSSVTTFITLIYFIRSI